ncbi:MAG: AAA family ATPase [Calditrichaeota bacterium]|nr:MAG: AAA family ATPase [Calditrichota bacterium]MBL1207106.1 AAA family ATPase [Calditrichota bacterium]NOG46936.1 AAA family ATPase [Calditrichota bacterium]
MAQSKKFGTFGGVFTPSLLTILGVIMYLRLPWIISQGGLFYTLAIIIVAHIVSVTTGLSVSSIATDKKVEAGGNYYIISRSLGLPIGGTLGIALFVGLSFSISLYIIGFSESLLSVLEIPIEISSIRLYGSITLVLLTIIIFISTSLAIKLQYFILAAVLLSLISIFMGGFDLPAEQYVLKPSPEGVDLFVLFGIFFPAVTGFTAGVQMSGDLKDPKKSIPFGTMAAIVLGFFVYVGLAIFIAYKIDAGKLMNDPNVLVSISWIPQLVIAGVWGATISSALGSILGAPRILQATSADNVTPKIFKKGYGASNEPRRALIFTFLIAEAGILIGELNIIARIVSIFFISTYGLINLSYAIESWASTDFRPTFKVPIWVGIVGALASAIIMFELDVVAFTAATIVLSTLYLYLKKKELTLETGDTWSSFWSAIVRTGLHRLNDSEMHKRNWRPNILLFRGASGDRPHLLDFGKWLTGTSGIISDFELVEIPDGSVQFTKTNQLVKGDDLAGDGTFKRRFECNDVYSGVESVAQFYGFSGVEPNTVILGWPKNSPHPQKLLALLKKLKSLDYNILLLEEDKNNPFGSFTTIDLWWRGGSNNATLAMALMRFLQNAKEWSKAKLRIFIIVEDSALINKVHRNMDHLLKELRQNGEIRIVNNAIEKRNFHEIMKVESAATDLTIVGMPNLENIDGQDFVSSTNSFIHNLNSVLLINASSFFEPYFIGIERAADQKTKSVIKEIQNEFAIIKLPADEVLAKRLKRTYDTINTSIEEFYSGYIAEIGQEFIDVGVNIKKIAESNFHLIEKKLQTSKLLRSTRLLAHVQSDILFNTRRILESFKEKSPEHFESNLLTGMENLFTQNKKLLENTPLLHSLYFEPKDLSISYTDPFSVKLLKAKKLLRNRFFKTEIRIEAKLNVWFNYYVNGFFRREFYNQIGQIGIVGYNIISLLQKTLSRLFDIMKNLEASFQSSGKISEVQITAVKKQIEDLFSEYENQVRREFKMELQKFLQITSKTFQEMATPFDNININNKIKQDYTIKTTAVSRETFYTLPPKWTANLIWMINFAGMELVLEDFKHRLKSITRKWQDELDSSVYSVITGHIIKIQNVLGDPKLNIDNKTTKSIIAFGSGPLRKINLAFTPVVKEIQKIILDLPENIDVISENSFQSLEKNQFEEQDIVSVYLRRLIGYIIDTDLINTISEKVDLFNQELQNFFVRIDDVQGLLSAGLSDGDEDLDIKNSEETDIEIIKQNGFDRLTEIKNSFEESYQSMQHFLSDCLHTAFDKMNPYLMTHSTNKLKQYIFAHEQKKVLGRIDSVKQEISSFFQKLAVNLQFTQSEGILFARKLGKLETNSKSKIDSLITLSKQLSPKTDIIKHIPRYYRQLFYGQQTINRQFLVQRNSSLKEADRIIKHYQQGYNGALLITGEPDSGKATLSKMVAGRFFDKKRIFHIKAPAGGTADPEDFLIKVQQSFKTDSNLKDIFNKQAPRSVIVLDDLEMWWQRSEKGFEVIDTIFNLIDSYSSKVFFIITVNKYAFQLINNIRNIEDSFVGIITNEAFNAKEIQSAILHRHRSTGIQFKIGKHLEDNISDFRMAGLFTDIFKYSNGAIGVALKTWLSMIESYSEDTITLKYIEKPSLSILSDLPKEWFMWLVEFTLHKELTRQRLENIFESNETAVKQMVEALLRSGFIIDENEVLKINPYMEHLFLEKFIQMGLLWNK